MKILVVVARDADHPDAAGGDLHVALLANELSREGHDVTVWCSGAPGLRRTADSGGVLVKRLAPSRLLAPAVWFRFLTGAARAYDVVLEEVIGGERIPFLGIVLSGRPCTGMWYQDNRPLFRASYGRAGVALATLAQAVLLRLYRGSYLITPSRASREWLIGSGVPPDRVVVHSPKVLGGRSKDSLPAFSARRNRFVTIGNIRPLKRFEEAIEVLQSLANRVPDAELVILGRRDDNEYLSVLKQRADASPVRTRISFMLNATEEEKFALLRSAKALTIHSPVEGFGWTTLEAGVSGVPIVANQGTPEDAVQEGINGTRLTFGDVEAYSLTLARLMTDEVEWSRFSAGATKSADRFTDAPASPEVEWILRRSASMGSDVAATGRSSS